MLPRPHLIKAVAIEAYRTRTLTAAEVGQLLRFGNRWELETFLGRNDSRLD